MGYEERTVLTLEREWSLVVLEVIFSVPDTPQCTGLNGISDFPMQNCSRRQQSLNPPTHALSLGLLQTSSKCCAEHISGLPFPFC